MRAPASPSGSGVPGDVRDRPLRARGSVGCSLGPAGGTGTVRGLRGIEGWGTLARRGEEMEGGGCWERGGRGAFGLEALWVGDMSAAVESDRLVAMIERGMGLRAPLTPLGEKEEGPEGSAALGPECTELRSREARRLRYESGLARGLCWPAPAPLPLVRMVRMEGAPPPLGSLELCPEVGLEDRWSRMLTPADGPGRGRGQHKASHNHARWHSRVMHGEGLCSLRARARLCIAQPATLTSV